MMRWYAMPIDDDLPAEAYRERAERTRRVADELSDRAEGARFEEMAADASEIARRKSLEPDPAIPLEHP